MNFPTKTSRWALLGERVKGMFNLNDPRWGRSNDKESGESRQDAKDAKGSSDSESDRNHSSPNDSKDSHQKDPKDQNQRDQRGQKGSQNPDLDELWRDLSRKLEGFLGTKGSGSGSGGGSSRGQTPNGKTSNIGIIILCLVAFGAWMSTGIFTVREAEQAVITRFGSYVETRGAGLRWHLPAPIERHEIVLVTELRSQDVGKDQIISSTGLRESAMLTEDENIVEIKFAVQYRLNDAKAYLFESSNPEQSVVQVAETAVREVVGKMRMDTVLAEERDQIAPRVRLLMQNILDRYKVGVEIVNVNVQQGGPRAPEQVQAAFDDVLRAGQEREKVKNEAEAYANDVIPRAVGAASRLAEEAQAYKSRIVAQADGDAQRFKLVLSEYQKAPQVTRDRMYLDAMQQIYTSVSKVIVDSRQGSNLLYLPLDKLMQQSGVNAGSNATNSGANSSSESSAVASQGNAQSVSGSVPVPSSNNPSDSRSRDGRNRDRNERDAR